MEKEPRKTGIDVIGDVPWGTHLCQFYQTKEDLIDILVPYFRAGLENNEFCMWVTSEPLGEEAAKEAMRRAVPDFDRFLKRGQIEIVPHTEWYPKDGAFDLQRVLNAWVDKLNQALAKGYDGMRVTGNAAWLEKRDWRSFTDYEEKVNNVIGKYRMLAVCTYFLDGCRASEVIDVVKNHQFALIRREGKWELIESSERKKLEEALKRLDEFSKTALDSISDAVSLIDVHDFRIVGVNSALLKQLGLKEEEVIGKTCYEITHRRSKPCAAPDTVCPLSASVTSGKHSATEHVHYGANGEKKYVEVSTSPVRDKNGKVTQVVHVSRDITERKQAEVELEARRKKLEAIMENVIDGIGVSNVQGKIVQANKALAEMHGYASPDEVIGRPFFDFVAEEELPRIAERFQEMWAKKEKTVENLEMTNLKKDGSKFPIVTNIANLWDKDGSLTESFVVVRDITERKRMEEALTDTNRRLQVLQQVTAAVHSTLDLEEVFRQITDAAVHSLGYTTALILTLNDEKKCFEIKGLSTRKRLLSQIDKILGFSFRKLSVPADPEFNAVVASVMKGRVAVVKTLADIAYPLISKKACLALQKLARTKNYILVPLKIEEGMVGAIFITSPREEVSEAELTMVQNFAAAASQAIKNANLHTQTKQAEQALRQSEENLRAYFESAPDGVYLNDLKGTFLYGNKKAEEIMGYKRKELVGKSFLKLNLLPAKYLAKAGKLLALNAMGKPTGPDELELIRKDGSRVWVEITTTPIKQQGEVVVIGFVRDITERKRAEEALRESEERFRDIAENTLAWIWEVDVNGEYTYASNVCEKILGYKPEELLGKHFYDLFPPDEREKLKEAAFETFTKKQPFREFINSNLHRNGEIVWLSTSGVPILDERGNLLGYRGVDTNITERKRTQEALRESEEKLKRMFESATDGIVVTDQNGNIMEVNEAAVRLYSSDSKEKLIGRSAFEFIAEKDRVRVMEILKSVLEDGQIRRDVEITFLTEDGREYFAEVSSALLKDASGNSVGFIAITRDITERKRMEEALRESEEKYKALFEQKLDGVVVIDETMKLLLANQAAAEIFGLDSVEELLEVNLFDYILPEERERILKIITRDMFENDLQQVNEFRFTNKAGNEIWISAVGTLIQYQGKVAGLASFRDITERKRAEEREKQLQQELNLTSRLASIGEIASGIAHEINNPLTGVIGFAQLLMQRDLPEDIWRDVEIINDGAQRVASIVSRLLTFARQHKPGREYININDAITSVLELRSYEMKVNNIEVVTQLAPHLPRTMADVNQLQQVFLNLIINAEKEMIKAHGRGKLSVKTEKMGDSIRLSFTDDGPGISKENLDKIFNPFFTTREVGQGTGLGLSVCHGIITQHNGRIYAQSKLGKGATFVVELPIVADTGQIEKAEAVQEEPWQCGGAKILVVDDETAILDFLKCLLTEQGYQVETVDRTRAALTRLRRERYDLILLDIKLPGKSGIWLYRYIEAMDPALAHRVLFITGDVMQTTTREFLDKTKVRYITKPLNAEQLKRDINHILTSEPLGQHS